MFSFKLHYQPSDIFYHDENKGFWTEWSEFFLSRTEEIETKGKVSAYQIAKERANRYAKELGVQLKFYVTAEFTKNLYYTSNMYVSKKPKNKGELL